MSYLDVKRSVIRRLRRAARAGKLPVSADRISDHVPGPPMVLRDEAGHIYWTSPWRFSPDGRVWAYCAVCGGDVEPSYRGHVEHQSVCRRGVLDPISGQSSGQDG